MGALSPEIKLVPEDNDESDDGWTVLACETCGRTEEELDLLDACRACGGVSSKEHVTLPDGTSASVYSCWDPIGCDDKVSRIRWGYLCEACWVAEFEDEAREHTEMLDGTNARRDALELALAKRGCALREDSQLCSRYIWRGEFLNKEHNSADKIAERMAQMRWLHECKAESYAKSLKKFSDEVRDTLEAGYFPDFNARVEAEDEVLLEEGGWPAVWPWRRHLMFMGLLRWIPMLMLRRKQAAERLYHPKRMRLEMLSTPLL